MSKEKKLIHVTLEKKIMYGFDLKVTDEEMEQLKNGDMTPMEEYIDDPEFEDWEYDYAIED